MKKTIKGKLVLSIALVISISMIIGLCAIYFIIDNREEEYIKQDIKAIGDFATNYIYSSKVVGDNKNIYRTVNDISEIFNIYTFLNANGSEAVNGKTYVSKDIEDFKNSEDKTTSKLKLYGRGDLWTGTLYAPIYLDGEFYGEIILQKDYSEIHKLNKGILIGIGTILAIMILILIGIVYLIVRSTTKPLEELTLAMKLFGRGERVVALEVKSKDEIGELTLEFNNMKSSISKLQDTSKEFFSNATHELKTPLTIIKGYTQILREEEFENKDVDFMLENIENEAYKMNYLIQKLLTLSKNNIVLNTEKENINVKEIVDEIINLFKVIIEEKKYNINLQCEELWIRGVKEDIVILISNLIDNAFKYCEGQEIDIKLYENKLTISNKCGFIKAEIKDNLLQPFVKGNSEKHKDSTGLGLYLCDNICRNNNFKLTYNISDDIISFNVDFLE
ncbi:MAG: histidine kinase dimerization/phospho-acceptor domain-containing protein [Clostridium sp.]